MHLSDDKKQVIPKIEIYRSPIVLALIFDSAGVNTDIVYGNMLNRYYCL
jgi:hypothetical protein